MSDAKLTKEMSFTLLSRLAEDDEFRARFEAAPARALVEIGVPAELVVNLKADCIERRTLASKETFQNLLRENAAKAIDVGMQMYIPTVGFRERSTAAERLAVEPALATQRVVSSERIAVH